MGKVKWRSNFLICVNLCYFRLFRSHLTTYQHLKLQKNLINSISTFHLMLSRVARHLINFHNNCSKSNQIGKHI